jgi:cytochrome c5
MTLPTRKSNAWWGRSATASPATRPTTQHDGALDVTCESCHDARSWAKAPTFDHDKADYQPMNTSTWPHTATSAD